VATPVATPVQLLAFVCSCFCWANSLTKASEETALLCSAESFCLQAKAEANTNDE
jgi:hypothetical protein